VWLLWLLGAACAIAGATTSVRADRSARGRIGVAHAWPVGTVADLLIWPAGFLIVATPVHAMHSWLGLLVALGGVVLASIPATILYANSPEALRYDYAPWSALALEIAALGMFGTAWGGLRQGVA
jgi:hypothetical protein